ncbi:hypothetical protein LOAG_04528 [Loa loa]|uniref:Uncharacterized protein n=1 Tax=Loa loa TaxID=7209 RepID=A0A1S0U1N4_LOALO|nr:hypothetical protein LOAG_04528 [Loa loa]EFO23955.1 hypothetical protein LOAG_04528 [Loa loa]
MEWEGRTLSPEHHSFAVRLIGRKGWKVPATCRHMKFSFKNYLHSIVSIEFSMIERENLIRASKVPCISIINYRSIPALKLGTYLYKNIMLLFQGLTKEKWEKVGNTEVKENDRKGTTITSVNVGSIAGEKGNPYNSPDDIHVIFADKLYSKSDIDQC